MIAPQAMADLRRLGARDRATILDAIERHLVFEPKQTSRSRIKRLAGLLRPQYRLRVDDLRVFYDVAGRDVQVLRILPKRNVERWLREEGETP